MSVYRWSVSTVSVKLTQQQAGSPCQNPTYRMYPRTLTFKCQVSCSHAAHNNNLSFGAHPYNICGQQRDAEFFIFIILFCTSQLESPRGGLAGNPGDSDSFLTSHTGGYDNGVQMQF